MDRHHFQCMLVLILLLSGEVFGSLVPGSDPDQTCNTCCQGFHGAAGVNGAPGPAGVPGSPGNNGTPGRDGRDGFNGRDGGKGDIGSKGEKGEVGIGERGSPGPHGSLGQRGDPGLRGLPGKVGPVGPVGPAEINGTNGGKGEKGNHGSKGESGRIGQSAFSVYKTGSQMASTVNEIIIFDVARVNIGEDFNLNTNLFTCQIPGVYFFTYSMYVTETISSANPDIYLVKDDVKVAHARTENVDKIQIGQSTMLELEFGNQVWLIISSLNEGIQCSNSKCHFSGFLLYEHE